MHWSLQTVQPFALKIHVYVKDFYNLSTSKPWFKLNHEFGAYTRTAVGIFDSHSRQVQSTFVVFMSFSCSYVCPVQLFKNVFIDNLPSTLCTTQLVYHYDD